MTSRGAEKMNNDTIGVDVSKDHLDAHRLVDGATRRFANDKGGAQSAYQMARGDAFIPGRVRTDRALSSRRRTRAGHRYSVPFVKVNPRQARRFVEATGKLLAKTDRLDAAILARMGAMLELEARPARKRALARTGRSFTSLAKASGEGSNRRQEPRKSSDALAAEASECSAPRTDRSPDHADSRSREILQIVEADASLADRFAILISIPGVSNITAFALLIAMPELRLPRSRPGRQPRRPANRPTVRALDRSLIYSRRSRRRPPRPSTCRPSSPLASIQT